MYDAEVEVSIVEEGGRGDADAAAVLSRVAHGSEHDRLGLAVDGDGARGEAGEHAEDGVEIDGRAAQKRGVGIGVAGDLRVEAEARNAEVAQAVRQRDVDGSGIALDGELPRSTEG